MGNGSELAVQTTIAWAVITYGLFIPGAMFFTLKFWRHRFHPFIERRRPKLMVFLMINYMVYLGIMAPLQIVPTFYNGNPFFHSEFYERLFKASGRLLLWTFCIRIWLAYFDFQKALDLVQMQWRSEVDTSYQPWTIKYQPYLGNWRFLGTIAGVLFVADLLYTVLFVALVDDFDTLKLLDMIGFMAPAIFFFLPCFYAAFKIQRCNDVFRIRTEVRISVFIFICIILQNPVILVTAPDNKFAARLGLNLDCAVVGLLEIWAALYWCVREAYWSMARDQAKSMTAEGRVIALVDILKDKTGFQLFADFSVKDFSVENLLFVIHYIQLKNLLLGNDLVSEQNAGWYIEMPQSMTDKHAVMNPKGAFTRDSALNRFVFLWNHYIHADAVAQVNIPEKQITPVRRAIYRASRNGSTIDIKGLATHTEQSSFSARLGFTAKRLSGVINNAEFKKFEEFHNSGHSKLRIPGLGDDEKPAADNDAIAVAGTSMDPINIDIDLSGMTGLTTKQSNRAAERGQKALLKLISVFDDVAKELFKLMALESHIRFTQTAEYMQYQRNNSVEMVP